jgi:hypothetical protein
MIIVRNRPYSTAQIISMPFYSVGFYLSGFVDKCGVPFHLKKITYLLQLQVFMTHHFSKFSMRLCGREPWVGF